MYLLYIICYKENSRRSFVQAHDNETNVPQHLHYAMTERIHINSNNTAMEN